MKTMMSCGLRQGTFSIRGRAEQATLDSKPLTSLKHVRRHSLIVQIRVARISEAAFHGVGQSVCKVRGVLSVHIVHTLRAAIASAPGLYSSLIDAVLP